MPFVGTLAHGIDPDIAEHLIVRAASARHQRCCRALGAAPAENLQLLANLRHEGLRLGLISNLDASEYAAWEQSPLAGCFDAAVLSCEAGMVKPEAAIYADCLRRLDVTAGECIFVGDAGGNELLGARRAGFYTVLFSAVIEELWPERTPTLVPMADVHVRTLSDICLLPVLRNTASQADVP
jgi:putative hydrolase of the HAD superfamily